MSNLTEKNIEQPSEESPNTFTGLKLKKPKKAAGGVPAVAVALTHVVEETGLIRGLKALAKLNQKGGFTCPSCAWPDPDDERSGIAEYCENGAKAVGHEATTKKIGAEFFSKNSVVALSLLSDYEIGKKGRIAEPMYIEKGATHYAPISWDDAFKKIATHLNKLPSPDEAVFYTSGRTSNEAAFLYQLFVREFGTNNLPDCSNMCHESSGVALTESLGIGKGSVKLEDFYEAEVIIVMGQNPGTNHPRMLTALQKAKANGAQIISVNPLPETGLIAFNNPQTVKGVIGWETKLTDIFLQVALNGDMALLQVIERLLLEEDDKNPGSVLDHEFIKKDTEGYDAFIAHIRNADIEKLTKESGISFDEIKKAVELLKNKNKIIVCWAMGLTQHKNAVNTIKEVANLLLMKGSIGKPGAGTCPVRGHSNVQGDRTMGINERPSVGFLDAIEKNFGFSVPRKNGYDVVDSIKAMHEGKAKVFFALGGNFLSATPDTAFTADALRKCELTVQVSTKLNRSHLVHGKEALILPCLSRSDKDELNGAIQFVTCENSMGFIHKSQGAVIPVSDKLLSEPALVCKLANAVLGSRSKINWDSYAMHYDHIRESIAASIPGFENFNERLQHHAGFYLPNCNRNGTFNTPSGKAHFNIGTTYEVKIKENELMMMTIRSHDQFNTTIYGLNDRYRGINNERRVILMNSEDLEKLNIKAGEVVDIINEDDGVRRVASKFITVPYSISKGCAATYFPETNVLVPINSVAEKSNTPVSKLVVIRLEQHIATT